MPFRLSTIMYSAIGLAAAAVGSVAVWVFRRSARRKPAPTEERPRAAAEPRGLRQPTPLSKHSPPRLDEQSRRAVDEAIRLRDHLAAAYPDGSAFEREDAEDWASRCESLSQLGLVVRALRDSGGGVGRVDEAAVECLRRIGVRAFEDDGVFDPARHRALKGRAARGPMKIVRTIRPGYSYQTVLIRAQDVELGPFGGA